MADSNSLEIRDLFTILFRRKWLVIAPVIMAAVVAYVGATYLRPKYEASTIVWIDRPSNVSRELIAIIGTEGANIDRRNPRQYLQALQNELTSKTYLVQLIQELKLDEDPDLSRQAAKMREQLPDMALERIKFNLLATDLKNRITVTQVGTDQIKISCVSTDPEQARDMASSLASIMDREKSQYELERILSNQSFADLQLEKKEHDFQVTMDSLTDAQSRLHQAQLPILISSEANRQEIGSDLNSIGAKISELRSRLEIVRDELADNKLRDIRMKFTDTLVELRAEIDVQVSQYVGMVVRFPWSNQRVINENFRLSNLISFLEDEIQSASEKQFGALPADHRRIILQYYMIKENLDVLESKHKRLDLALTDLVDRIQVIPKLTAEVTERQAQVDEARRFRNAFRSEGATVGIITERLKERTKYKVIEPARVPLAPFWPNKRQILMMGLMLGLAIGGAAIFIVEILDNTYRRTEDIEQELGLPVLAAIPKIDNLKAR